MWHAWERRGKCTGFWLESRKEGDHLEDLDIDRMMGSEWMSWRLSGGCGVDSSGSG
jgi:hypothetical protein